MNKEGSKRTAARVLIALLAVALVFTMMPLSMGKAFAAEDTSIEGLTLDGDVAAPLAFENMKEMKNDPAVKELKKEDVAFHAVNKKGTPFDVTVKGITLEDLIGIAGLADGAELISAKAVSGIDQFGVEYTAEYIQNPDMSGNKAMFAWGMTEDGKDAKVQTVVRGQMTEADINKSDWVTDTQTITVKALDKPVITVKAGKKKAAVNWTADPDAEQYIIMRATKKAGKYAELSTAESGTTSFTDKKVKKGKTYFYKVKAATGSVENLSAPKKVKIK